MCEDIPYGPERKPWVETLSSWGKDGDGKFLVSPPAEDPLKLHNFPKQEKGITPTFYQVTTQGFSEDHCTKAQVETAECLKVTSENYLGFPGTLGNDYSVLSSYLSTSCNNIGDPFKPGASGKNTKWMERNVLDHYASLWNAKWPHNDSDPESYWGYILTMGSSEGNIFGLWKARDYLQGKFIFSQDKYSVKVNSTKKMPKCVNAQAKPPNDNPNVYTPVLFYSEEAHGSISKAAEMLELKSFYDLGIDEYPNDCPLGTEWPCEVPSQDDVSGPGNIDVNALYKLVDFFTDKGHPVIIVLNYGTTFKGGYDDVKEVGERLMPLLKNKNMDERCCEVVNPFTSKIVRSHRKGFWIHVDGALGASYMPFHQMAFNKGCTDVKPASIFDFRLPYVCSITTSGHKFPGAPVPTGIFMTKTGLLISSDLPATTIGCPDTTFSGSRSGIAAIIWWTYISSHDYNKQVNKVLHCLNLVKATIEKLKRLESKIGKDLWIAQAPSSLAVLFKKPNDNIIFKYSLPSETMDYKGEMRTYTHVFLMGGTTEAKINELMEALEAPNAFD